MSRGSVLAVFCILFYRPESQPEPSNGLCAPDLQTGITSRTLKGSNGLCAPDLQLPLWRRCLLYGALWRVLARCLSAQISGMLAVPLNHLLHIMPTTHEGTAEKADAIVGMFEWVASSVAPKDAEAPSAFCKLVHAIASVFNTSRPQESLLPGAPQLREARQTIREASRGSGVVSELAKAMNVYEGPTLAMLQAQLQSKAKALCICAREDAAVVAAVGSWVWWNAREKATRDSERGNVLLWDCRSSI